MNPLPEDQVLASAIDALERVSEAADVSSQQALNRARQAALGGVRRSRSPGWMWATAAAAVVALVVGIAKIDRLDQDQDQELLAQHALVEEPITEPDLYQEMEFYLWLSEALESE